MQTSNAVVASRQELVDVQRKNDRLHRRIAPEEPRTTTVSIILAEYILLLLVMGTKIPRKNNPPMNIYRKKIPDLGKRNPHLTILLKNT